MPVELPHAPPFVLLDEVIERVHGEYAVARRLVSQADPLVSDRDSLPELLLIEAMAQCAGIAAVRSQTGASGVLVAIDKFNASEQVVPGDLLVIAATIVKRMGAMVRARTTVHVGDQLRAEAELTLRMGPPAERAG